MRRDLTYTSCQAQYESDNEMNLESETKHHLTPSLRGINELSVRRYGRPTNDTPLRQPNTTRNGCSSEHICSHEERNMSTNV